MHSSQLIYVAQLYGGLTCSSCRGRVDAEANHGRGSVGTVSWKSNSHYYYFSDYSSYLGKEFSFNHQSIINKQEWSIFSNQKVGFQRHPTIARI